jgi:hypothetical protein
MSTNIDSQVSRESPFTWQKLQELHDSIVDITIPRLPHVLQAYTEYKETGEYKNFGVSTLRDKVRNRPDVLMGGSIDEMNGMHGMHVPHFIILQNDFPYYVESGIHHYIAWYVHHDLDHSEHPNHSIPESAIFALYRYLGAVLGTSHRTYCAFQNSIHMQTIHTVSHIHVFTNGLRLQECVIPC